MLLAPLPDGLSWQGKRALAIFLVCVVLWATDAIPIAVTGLLALLLLPVTQAMSQREAFALFGNPAVFFILGAFILAAGMMASGLSVRLALNMLRLFGSSPRRLVAGTMISAGLLTFIMPEHAVAAMLLPAVMEVAHALKLRRGRSNYGKLLFLALAWGAVIGGVGTFLGGARNILAVALLREFSGQEIGFLEWMVTVVPLVVVMMAGGYLILTRLFLGSEVVDVKPVMATLNEKIHSLGPMSRGERGVLAIMGITILAWILPLGSIGMAETAMGGAALLFVFNLVSWAEVQSNVNWGVILMYGGAVALGRALQETGVANWLVVSVLPQGLPPMITVGIMIALAMLLTEMVSNAAAVAIMLPMALPIGQAVGLDPKLVTFAVAVPAGLAFCLPVGTPPNAICFASGYYQIHDSVRGGIRMLAVAWITIMLAVLTYWRLLGLNGG